MDAELKAKWVQALRSGDYKQTNSYLRDERGHCCLGVLCEVAGMKISDGGSEVVIDGEELGYQPLHEALGRERMVSTLYGMNDRGESFLQIADYIEVNL